MTDAQFADLVVAEAHAKADFDADPTNNQKFLTWYTLSVERSHALSDRQVKRQREQYPAVHFERVPDEDLL